MTKALFAAAMAVIGSMTVGAIITAAAIGVPKMCKFPPAQVSQAPSGLLSDADLLGIVPAK